MRRFLRLTAVLLTVLVVFAGLGLWIFLELGSWLIVEDPVAQAQAIVVLSGLVPDRAIEAARLYQENFASQLWVSQPAGPGPRLARMNIAFVGEDFYNEKVLMAKGVPADAIRILEMPASNTEEEVDEIAADCRRDQVHSVIVVTSKPHTRRVRLIWRLRVGDDPKLILRYPRDDSFDAGHWWRTSSDALEVVREWLGIVNAEFGFPAHPAPH